MNTENNKLLAEFMGKKELITESQFLSMEHKAHNPTIIEYLKYDTDWNDLMQIVEKIEQLRYVTEISGNIERKFTCIAYPNTSEEYISRIGYGKEMFLNKKYVTYQAVVAFIKWYNEQNK